jgi:hypothetical protein
MIFKSPLISVGSGKLAGTVITRGRGNSLVMRKLSVPVNPNTASQALNRSYFAGLAGAWATVLTGAQRLAWEGYAGSVTVINKLGDAVHLSGISMYIRNNQIRLAASLLRIDDAPAIHTLGSPPDLTGVTWIGTTPFGLNSSPTLPEPETSGSLIIRCSKPQNAGRNFFKGPFTFIANSEFTTSDTTVALDPSLADLEAKVGTLTTGQSIFVQCSYALDDGRCSNPSATPVVIGATS